MKAFLGSIGIFALGYVLFGGTVLTVTNLADTFAPPSYDACDSGLVTKNDVVKCKKQREESQNGNR